jgi:F0F1-type ATP synthase epsilon subunit
MTEASDLLATKTPPMPTAMHVKVYSPFHIYYNENALSISAESDTGPFDILPSHHNFMTLLTPCELTIRKTVGEQRIRITGGIMHVKANQVVVFLDV